MIRPGLIERLYWLIRLRWVAVMAVLSAVLLTGNVFKIFLPTLALYVIAMMLTIYNFVLLLLLKSIRGRESAAGINKIANTQISLDLFILAVLIHFSGGIENPF